MHSAISFFLLVFFCLISEQFQKLFSRIKQELFVFVFLNERNVFINFFQAHK